jgi:hypothetical protein
MKKFLAVWLLLIAFTGKGYSFNTTVKQDIMRYGAQDAIDMSMNVSYLFIPLIIELEKQGVGIFGSCKVFFRPVDGGKVRVDL